MEPGSIWQYMVLILLLLLSAFFSMSETALTSLNKIRLRHMREESVKGSELVTILLEDHRKLLTTLLIGNNITNLAASALTTVIALEVSGGKNMLVGLFTGLLTLAILVFGEITPKSFAASNSERISFLTAKIVYVFLVLFSPLTFVLNKIASLIIDVFGGEHKSPLITEDEIKTVVTVGHEEGLIEVEEREMINNVFDFGDFDAKDVMTPRTDIIAVSIEATADEIREIFMTEQFSRLPVYKDNNDNIVGILHLKDFIFKTDIDKGSDSDFQIESFMREPYYTYEFKPASELFITMRTKRIPMAIVIDEYGGTAGIITLEDLVEEIVGEISDEYDEPEKDVECVKDDEFIVDGGAKISDVNDLMGIKLESEDFDSVGGYVMGAVGRLPVKGDEVDCEGIKFVVEEIDKNRIARLRIKIGDSDYVENKMSDM